MPPSRPGLRRRWVVAGILLVWVAATARFFAVEILPRWSLRPADGYRAMLSEDVLVTDTWMRILMRDVPIGYSHTEIDVNEEDRNAQYLIQNQTALRLAVLGTTQRVKATAHAVLDSTYCLRDFSFHFSTRDHAVVVQGTRGAGQTFDLAVHTGGSTHKTAVEIPDDAVIYSPMMEMALRALKPGQQTRIRIFNPLSQSPSDLVIRALRRETRTHRGTTLEATVLATDMEGMEILTWVDAAGRILRQETPFGWVMEACDQAEALAADAPGGRSGDVLAAAAVPLTGDLADPHSRPVLRLRLEGAGSACASLASHRQTVERRETNVVDLRLERETLPAHAPALGTELPADAREHLGSSAFLQAGAPEIVRQAAQIAGAETNSLRVALALYEWVYRRVNKVPTVSFPSALDVLRTLEGDCNEHTYLFVALARAVGLPAEIQIGLVYHEGAFYYHAWPAVYVGRWLEMDPTLGQATVDATHVRLIEGESRDQMKLTGLIGRLKATVLDGEPAKEAP